MSSSSTFFSTPGEDVVNRTIDVNPDQYTPDPSTPEFDDFYDIETTATEIVKSDYKRITLQFPDELLRDSVPVFQRLKHRIGQGRQLYVLADTSYGSCCVDEVAASHVDADVTVHYGHACMTQTSRLPVIYVFGKKSLNVDLCVSQLASAFDAELSSKETKTLWLKHDVAYTHQADLILERIKEKMTPRGISEVIYHEIPSKTKPGLRTAKPSPSSSGLSDPQRRSSTLFYIGSESLGLTNLLLINSSCNVYSFDPQTNTARLESAQTNRLLMRRYATVQKARDADVFGILVGTLGVASYLPLIRHLRSLLAKRQKKSYTISVGKLNPAKLANFLEIECFILVACPENSLIEAKDFLRPIVTPYELEIALEEEPIWDGQYILDFGQLLLAPKSSELSPSATGDTSDISLQQQRQQPGQSTDSDSDQPVFSLITGTYRHPKRYNKNPKKDRNHDVASNVSSESAAVILRNQNDTAVATTAMDNAAGQFLLQQRTYRGLEVRLGEDAPSVLEQGRSGIARGYQDDLEHQDYH